METYNSVEDVAWGMMQDSQYAGNATTVGYYPLITTTGTGTTGTGITGGVTGIWTSGETSVGTILIGPDSYDYGDPPMPRRRNPKSGVTKVQIHKPGKRKLQLHEDP